MSSNNNNYDSTNVTETTPINKDRESIKLDLLSCRSITLENKGSVARDHMANERTFLAWLRTSLSFITLGIGMTQLFRLEHPNSKVKTMNNVLLLNDNEDNLIRKLGKPLGATFIIIGILTLIFGFNRYFKVQIYLTKSFYPATRLSLFILISLILILTIITLVMVLKTAT
ncbi:unnamed protein product [Candida verbasci]|uniref:DUF202 domain-containing protein n=1 Tax=Candida verbasci TaxID=1227364 RepID=A0A9W4TUK3_9ASCO|nr:unnamed protein product [Candida verbasci]